MEIIRIKIQKRKQIHFLTFNFINIIIIITIFFEKVNPKECLKDQLNNINYFGDKNAMYFSSLNLGNRDCLLFSATTASQEINKQRFLCIIKNNNDYPFSNDFSINNRILLSDNKRESNALVKININETEYILNCDLNFCEFIDIEKETIIPTKSGKIVGYQNFRSTRITLLSLFNNDYFLFGGISKIGLKYYLVVTKFYFYFNNDTINSEISYKNNYTIFESFYNDMASCFETELNFIECLYIASPENKFFLAIFDKELIFKKKFELHKLEKTNGDFFLFNGCINLQKEIGICIYFVSDIKPPYLIISNLNHEEEDFELNDLINNEIKITINENNNLIDHFPEYNDKYDLKKVNNNRFIYVYTSYEYDNILILVLFDLFTNSLNNLKIRYFKICLSNYNIIPNFYLSSFFVGDLFGVGFSNKNDAGSRNYAVYIIFGSTNYTESNTFINLNKYSKSYELKIKEYINHNITIDNNIFGYELAGFKIISGIDNFYGIKCLLNNNNQVLKINDILKVEDEIILDYTDINITLVDESILNLKIGIIISEPDYAIFNSLAEKIENYGDKEQEDFYIKNYFVSKVKEFQLSIKCYNFCSTCRFDNSSLIDQICLDCEEGYYLDYTTNICLKDCSQINYYNYLKYPINKTIICLNDFQFEDLSNNKTIKLYLDNNTNTLYSNCSESKNNKYHLGNYCVKNCSDNYKSDEFNNCVKDNNCEYLYYRDNLSNFICLSSKNCPSEYPVLNETTNECHNCVVKYNNECYLKCPLDTCTEYYSENPNICVEKTSGKKILNGQCFNNTDEIYSYLKQIASQKWSSKEVLGISVYSSGISMNELIEKYKNSTVIDINECTNILQKNYGTNADFYVVAADFARVYENETINRFDYELYLDNNEEIKELTDLNLCDKTKIKVSSPIIYINESLYDLAVYFKKQDGNFDIFDKNDKFYNDICAPINSKDNDLTLNDRKMNIYPKNISICAENCEYSAFNITTKRAYCHCPIKKENTDYFNLTNDEEIVKFFKDYKNVMNYIGDLINYKIIKCYKLLLDFNKYKLNIGFYLALGFYIVYNILFFSFRVFGINKLKIYFYKMYIFSLKKRSEKISKKSVNEKKDLIINTDVSYSGKRIIRGKIIEGKKKKLNSKTKRRAKKNKTEIIANSKSSFYHLNSSKNVSEIINTDFKEKDKSNIKSLSNKKIKHVKLKIDPQAPIKRDKKTFERNRKKRTTFFLNINTLEIKKNFLKNLNKIEPIMHTPDDKIEEKDYNELPFTQAQRLDKRNLWKILISVFIDKIDVLKSLFKKEKYSNRFMLLNMFLFSTSLDLLNNCLLFNDYAVSQKYHNEGKVEFITSLVLSLSSNIITSIILNFLKFLVDYPYIIELISKEVYYEHIYMELVMKFFRYIRIKLSILFFCQSVLGLFMIYYLFIFNVIYSNSWLSFFYDFCLTQLESIGETFFFILLISSFRWLGLRYIIRELYNISKFLNEKF